MRDNEIRAMVWGVYTVAFLAGMSGVSYLAAASYGHWRWVVS